MCWIYVTIEDHEKALVINTKELLMRLFKVSLDYNFNILSEVIMFLK